MNLFNLFNKKIDTPDKMQLAQELISILKTVRVNISDDSDCDWSYFETPQQARSEIDQYIVELKNANMASLPDISTHFAPTAGYQELSLQNGWSDQYIELADKFDTIHSKLKNCS